MYIKPDNIQYQLVKAGFAAYVYAAPNSKEFVDWLKEDKIGRGWSLFYAVSFDLMYDDSHPAYRKNNRVRVVEHNPVFNMYFDEKVNDEHWHTAIMKIVDSL